MTDTPKEHVTTRSGRIASKISLTTLPTSRKENQNKSNKSNSSAVSAKPTSQKNQKKTQQTTEKNEISLRTRNLSKREVEKNNIEENAMKPQSFKSMRTTRSNKVTNSVKTNSNKDESVVKSDYKTLKTQKTKLNTNELNETKNKVNSTKTAKIIESPTKRLAKTSTPNTNESKTLKTSLNLSKTSDIPKKSLKTPPKPSKTLNKSKSSVDILPKTQINTRNSLNLTKTSETSKKTQNTPPKPSKTLNKSKSLADIQPKTQINPKPIPKSIIKSNPIKKSPQKHVQFDNNSKNKNLRPRRANKKYKDFENSLAVISDEAADDLEDEDEDNDKTDHNKNIPVYKKLTKKSPLKKQSRKDIYDFEIDSIEESQSDSDNEYDKEMIQEMQQIKRFEKRKAVEAIRKIVHKKQAIKSKQNLKVQKIEGYAVQKVNENERITKERINKKENDNLNINLRKKVDILQNLTVKSSIKSTNQANAITSKTTIPQTNVNTNHTKLDKINEQHEDSFIPCDFSEEHATIDDFDAFDVHDIAESFIEPENHPSNSFKKPIIPTISSSTPQRQINTNKGKHIQSSIMTRTVCGSPMRSNLIFRNGPYILQTKGDNLPSYNQEVVLNSTVVESHNPVFNCRISAILPQHTQEKTTSIDKTSEDNLIKTNQISANASIDKKTKQTSILSFIPGKQQSEEVDLHCTLFDENLLLSPVKNSTPVRNLNANFHPNLVEKRQTRSVLRDMTNLQRRDHFNSPMVVNTPEKEGSDVEFFALSPRNAQKVQQVPAGKPTRFNMKSPKKIGEERKEFVAEDKNQEKVEQVANEEYEDASVFDSPASQSKNVSNDADVVGIFEDFHALEVTRTELPSFTYVKKRKRVRRVSYASEPDEDEEELHEDCKKKRKKKAEMTKKEKDEFENWAHSFNVICNEIDDYSLEVE